MFATLSPYDHHHTFAEKSRCDVAGLTMVESIVRRGKMRSGKHLGDIREIQSSLSQGLVPFRAVEGDRHDN